MTARVVLHPGPGESAADLCRDLIAICDRRGAVRSTGGRGFAVDRDVALLYLQHSTDSAVPAGDVDAPALPAGTVPNPPTTGVTAADGEPETTTTAPPPPGAAPAGASVRPRRVPTRKATMRGNPDGE